MTVTISLIFLIVAIVCFALAAFAVKGPAGGWVAIGLLFLALHFWPA